MNRLRHPIDLRFRLAAAVSAIAICVLPAAGVAQPAYDHLQCHKVKDGQKFRSAVVSLQALAEQAQFQVPDNCVVKGRASAFCVPVTKTVVETDAPATLAPPSPQDLSQNDYVCYKVKCPLPPVTDVDVTDQFGFRGLGIKKASQICVPAVKGVVTTTTSTTTTTTTTSTTTTSTTTTTLPACNSVAAPSCGGVCPALESCVDSGGTCVCQPSTCGVSGAPSCGGTCPAGSTCVNIPPEGSASGDGTCVCEPLTACADTDSPTCGGYCFGDEVCTPAENSGDPCFCQ